MKLSMLLSRADEESIQNLLGRQTVRLILALNKQERVKERFIDVLLTTVGEETLLRIPEKRNILFSLLKIKEAEDLVRQLGISGTNNYHALQSQKIPQYSLMEEKVFKFFEVKYEPRFDEIDQFQPIQSQIASHELFSHQRAALRELESYFLRQQKRVLLHMPTGSGKTRTAMRLVAKHLLAHEPTVVVWLASGEELCEQALSEFCKTWQSVGDRQINTYRFWGKFDPEITKIHDGLLVCGISKAFNKIKKDIGFIRTIASRTTLIVMDEAHQAIAPSFQILLDALYYSNQETCLLGLSATPGRSYLDASADRNLAEFFNQNKVRLSVEGYDNPVEYLISEGYLARATYTNLDIQGTKLSQDEMDRLEKSFEIPQDIIEKIVVDDLRNLKIIAAIEELLEKHSRILVFAASVEHAEMLCFLLQYRKHKAYLITADTATDSRRNIIQEFKSADNDRKILCNFGVLTTGFDAPQTSAAVIARPTKSLVLYSQMVGRVTRGPKAGGQKEAEILTVVDIQLPGFRDMVEAFTNWEDVWQTEGSLDAKDKIK